MYGVNYNVKSNINDLSLSVKIHFDLGYYELGLLAVLMGLVHGCALLIYRSYYDKCDLFDENILTKMIGNRQELLERAFMERRLIDENIYLKNMSGNVNNYTKVY